MSKMALAILVGAMGLNVLVDIVMPYEARPVAHTEAAAP
jgi:hypothetical protein